jgi:arabinogalactan oligomer/maltooligosaccharide transport system permease protein
MDLSRPPTDYLPKGRGGVGAGLFRSLGLLSLALALAAGAGVAGYLLLRLLFPDIPAWSGLLVGLAALIAILRAIALRYAWIMPWYYILPAILFLLTFTFFPVVLTVILAFTDYAGVRNGELNVATTTRIVAAQGDRVTLETLRTLNCEALRDGCNNVRARIYASGQLEVDAVGLEGAVLTLVAPPPEGRRVTAVTLELVDFGFSAEFPVVEIDGPRLTLGRVPPGAIDLTEVVLRLDREAIERRMLRVENSTVILNEPLPEGFEYEALARYNDFGFIGLRNFERIIAQANRALLPVFTWNVAFAFLTVLINTTFGVFIAVLLNNPDLKLRNFYRTLLIVSWALPNIITIQVWRGFLNTNFGAINRLLALLDLPTFDWLGEPTAARAAVLLVNLWLGLPFMMTATLGALSAIPRELYEAAKIDGASAWQSFWRVTAPLLRSALVPITLTGFAFNFNNFNIIFLLTGGGPPVAWGTATARGTDILISWAYNEAFQAQGAFAYGLGSAISVFIFVITVAVSLINFRVTGALKEESNV